MSERTAIGWTEATWNPVTGCSHVSPGCVNCYAETLSLRMGWSKLPWTAQNAGANVKLHEKRLTEPLRWKTPRRVFVNSMSDLFHEQIPDGFVDEVFNVMARAERHTFQILTKRPGVMREYVTARLIGKYPLRNVWLGVSVEDQRNANERLPLLMQTPAAVRFVSFEPLLGSVSPRAITNPPMSPRSLGLVFDWAIIGGESGADHRPMDVGWAEQIARECDLSGIPVFVKQDSGLRPGKQGRLPDALWARKEYPA
jgi:protein gp37